MFSLVPSLLNTNENLAWQGNEKSLHQRGGRGGGWENFGTRTLNLSKPRKSLGLVPHLFPPYLLSPIRLAIRQTYERLFSSNESYENEASQFNGEQFTISCLFHRRDNTLFVSWNRANEKRGGWKERAETAQYPPLFYLQKLIPRSRIKCKLCKIHLFNY